MKLVYSLVVITLTIVYLIMCSFSKNEEGFYGGYGGGPDDDYEGGPAYCQDCNRRGQLGMNACMSCNNCGWCIDPNGNGSCVLGDNRGPYFADCVQYYFNGGVAALPPVMAPLYRKRRVRRRNPWRSRWF